MGSLATGDLTTLTTAKAFLTNAPNDNVLSGLITRVSRSLLGFMNRPSIVPTNYLEKYNGTGTQQLVLFNWPIISVASLTIQGINITPANVPTLNGVPLSTPWGYRYAPPEVSPPGAAANLELIGIYYLFGQQSTIVSYRAGYMVSDELQIIPATPFQVTPNMPFGQWATDEGVTYATTGVALTPIASGTPATGQYIPPNPSVGQNYYAFASGDSGTQVSLSYGYVPADLEEAALETVAERAAYRTRPGVRSQSLAGQETISYGVENRVGYGLSAYVMDILGPYCNVLPPPIGADV